MPPFSRRLASCWLLFFASLVVCPGAAAATPRNELLRLVPPDVGFCLVIEDLRGRSAAFFASDFARHFRESPLARALAQDPEVRKLLAFDQVLQKQLGISAARLRDDILGDAVVVAYRPGPPGKPEQEQGLFLVRARDARLLAELVQRLDQVQKESGELKEVEIRTYQGRTYHRRVERKGETYYYRSGPLLALSPQEAMLRQALACDLTAPADEEPPIACQLRRLGADRQLVAVWINPRAFTAEIEGKAGRAGAAEAAALNNFLTYWKALEGIALSAGAPQDFELRLSLRARTEELPAPARRLLAAAAQPASLWARFPDDALLAAAGRLDAEALLGVLDGFLTPATRRALYDSLDRTLGAALGRAGIKELLPHIGPEWGLCVTAPPAGSNWFPHAVLALQVRPGNPTDPVDQALLSALHSCAMLAVVGYNRQHQDQILLKAVRQGDVEVKYLTGDRAFPPGLQPAFTLHEGYLVLASSPEALRRLGIASPVSVAPSEKGRGKGGNDEVLLLRISLKELHRYLNTYREPLIAASAERNRTSHEEARRSIDGLLLGLQFFDHLELSQQATAGRLTLTLRLRPTRPLDR